MAEKNTPSTLSEDGAQTPSEAKVEIPIWGYELEDYINIGTASAPKWLKVTNLLSWELDDDAETYEPDYIDAKTKKSFIVGKSASISYEKDAYRNNEFDEFLMEHEDDTNIPVEVMRVRTWQATDGKMFAKKAAYTLTPMQLDKNSKGEPVKLKGDLNMAADEWTKGTWDGTAFAA